MKEATGELNMTIITVIAIAGIGAFLWMFLPQILKGIESTWGSGCAADEERVYIDGKYICQ